MRAVIGGFFFFQAEDGIRDLVRSRGLGDVYKRQQRRGYRRIVVKSSAPVARMELLRNPGFFAHRSRICLLYTSDAADERSSVDLGGRRIIKKKKDRTDRGSHGYKDKVKETEQLVERSRR